MSEPVMLAPSKAFANLVRSALAHLFDVAYLQTHPFGALLTGPDSFDSVTRAQRLRVALLDCVETLRPQDYVRPASSAARAYAILTHRYIDELSMEDIAGRLSLSRRQVYREHERGIDAIGSLLLERYPRLTQLQSGPTAGAYAVELATAEIDRLKLLSRAEPLALEDVLDDIQGMFIDLKAQASIEIHIDLQVETGMVMADRVFLRQALINLFTYAIEIARADVNCVVRSDLQAGVIWLSMSVPSTPAQFCSGNEQGGLCVGLAASRALIESQKGELSITTDAVTGEWSARILLPAVSHQASVLVIDDNLDFVDLFRRYLSAYQVSVFQVSDGQQALPFCLAMHPTLITLDLMMPYVDGWDILQQLKRTPQTCDIPIIVCSVLNEVKLARSMGASGYLTKPVNQADFLAVLQPWIARLPASA